MSKQPSDRSVQSRRKALKGLAVGGGSVVVTKWSKPVVDAVIVPAHAQASGPSTRSGLQEGAGGRVTQTIVFEE